MLSHLNRTTGYMTKLEASVDKEVALVAKTSKVPKNSAWFIFHAQVSNNLGQPVISDFIVIGLNPDGSLFRNPIHLNEFIQEYNLTDKLFTESIPENELSILQNILENAVAHATEHMQIDQMELEIKMEEKLNDYKQKIETWRSAALEQLELDFSERSTGAFWSRIKDSKQREIETILSTSSQYYKDLTSLQGDAYLKVLAVFYNL